MEGQQNFDEKPIKTKTEMKSQLKSKQQELDVGN
jgi:hypothetical protein